MYAASLRLPDDIGQRLAQLAERTGRFKTFYIIEAIKEHLEDVAE
ncbi:MAG: ribbon-helix-helix domain-containing protein [Desulfovibrionaceae bacterium]|nr:ribbon-helix-helix domain-containing protein [Desulfovibrionaceae bacterium]